MIDRTREYEDRLELYYEAERAILSGAQSYSIGSRNLTRANLSEINETIGYLIKRIEEEKSRVSGKGKNRVVGIIPRDL